MVRATTIHKQSEPLQGDKDTDAQRGWSCDKNPDGRYFWRHSGGELRWTDPSLTLWARSVDPDAKIFWVNTVTGERTWTEPRVFDVAQAVAAVCSRVPNMAIVEEALVRLASLMAAGEGELANYIPMTLMVLLPVSRMKTPAGGLVGRWTMPR